MQGLAGLSYNPKVQTPNRHYETLCEGIICQLRTENLFHVIFKIFEKDKLTA